MHRVNCEPMHVAGYGQPVYIAAEAAGSYQCCHLKSM